MSKGIIDEIKVGHGSDTIGDSSRSLFNFTSRAAAIAREIRADDVLPIDSIGKNSIAFQLRSFEESLKFKNR